MIPALVIGGPTASGKSKLALHLALHHSNAIIINADSMQLYQGLKTLSAQPEKEDLKLVPHALYGILNHKSQPASLASWIDLVKEILIQCKTCNQLPIIVGGTGMYLYSLIFGLSEIPPISEETKIKTDLLLKEKGLLFLYQKLEEIDPEYAIKISQNDPQRILRAYEVWVQTGKKFSEFHENNKRIDEDYFFHPLTLNPDRETLYQHCNSRLEQMLGEDLKQEILACDQTYPETHIIRKTLGFKELLAYYKDEMSRDEALMLAQQMTRNYAKRQYTWFRNRMLNIQQNHFVATPIQITDPSSKDLLLDIKKQLQI